MSRDVIDAMRAEYMREPMTATDLRVLAGDIEGDPTYRMGDIHAARLRALADWLDANGGPDDE